MKKDLILIKQLIILEKHEQKFLNQDDHPFLKSNITPMVNKIQTKIPEKLQATLDKAFYLGFHLVFEKGNPIIEKTYHKETIEMEYDLNNYAIEKHLNKKHLKKLDRSSKHSKTINESIAAIEGGVLGLLGIGLPDIPLFLGVIIKTINEIALSYGYSYTSDEEKAYMLFLICAVMTKNDQRKAYDQIIEDLGQTIDTQTQPDIDLDRIMKETSDLLSNTLLTAKFIQGLPLVGVIGGVVNPLMINKIGKYARIKYKKRYLLAKLNMDVSDPIDHF
ncbi:EcsC family protein [Acetobacterium woodii]|uniref:EcsC family protein n=1 Tax=Acetobacterium woodii TaxID=33952 RepID=UPI0002DDFFE2|nr:EcsC family protein [Acetobacterium woodii]